MRESQQISSIQPFKLANKEGELSFKWPVSEFKRLSEMLLSETGEVNVKLEGLYDHRKRCLIVAKISAQLTLECQTSFEPIDYQVDHETTYCAVVAESQFAEVEEEYEPVLVEEGYLDIKQVIEDELILAVPLVANKPLNEIEQKMSFGELDEAKIAAAEKADNPFSVLENLKKT
ncbi:hypothetical protein FLL45_05715 [Aliikangiella marina]|uniref:Large ribosomal RNA subunit accumulation protein YceD n=1 Tax=Aliikangiella marina TaxID=1712262 RepID=A0A545TJN4_9GAMM|nr:YceD family protein [Aliikangiella marina]TQV77440.1 hypothetical protein FLL45_05715 [Aliikangiella marina]